MAYKIQGLDSDSFVSAKQKAESKNKKGSQNNSGGNQAAKALVGVLSSNLDELQRHLDLGEEVSLPSPKKGLSSETLEDVLAQIASLTNKLQQYEAKFQDSTNSISCNIGKAAIKAAQSAATKLEAAIKKEASEKHTMSILGDIEDAFAGLAVLGLCISQNYVAAGMMVGFMLAQKTGVTNDLQNLVVPLMKKAGCSTETANAIGSGVVCVVEIVLSGIVASAASAAQETATASEGAVNAVVKTAVKAAVKDAVEDAVTAGLKDGVSATSDDMQTLIKNAAKTAAKNEMSKFAQDGLGSAVVNAVSKDAISEGIEDGVSSALEKAGKTISKTILKALVKTVANDVSAEVADDIGQVASKGVKDLTQDLKNKLEKAGKDLKWNKLKGALKMAVSGSVTSSGFIQNFSMAMSQLGHSKKDKEWILIMSMLILSLAALAGTISGGMNLKGGSITKDLLQDGVSGAKQEGNVVAQMLKRAMATVTSPAKLMNYSQIGAGVGDAATQMAMANAQVTMSEIEDQMAVLRPTMSVNSAAAKIQDQLQAQSQKLFQQLYKAIPTLMADANSIATLFGKAAQALAS
ncbi:MAG: hypothetical protein P0S95_02155 [Rhabdochlamydiaceae bacterium]|nr:hypothetical protein [Candidatus Amphrikana amoebophyrae]